MTLEQRIEALEYGQKRILDCIEKLVDRINKTGTDKPTTDKVKP